MVYYMKKILVILLLFVSIGVNAQSVKGYKIGDSKSSTKKEVVNTTVGGMDGTIMIGFFEEKISTIVFTSGVILKVQAEEFIGIFQEKYGVQLVEIPKKSNLNYQWFEVEKDNIRYTITTGSEDGINWDLSFVIQDVIADIKNKSIKRQRQLKDF